ncbi:prepilin-type N-terminal cleavage/methylation domain-containing protein [Thalassotalea maritima]|uniref:type IV pilus modification PilV family protein n=1 Tax=Thalassotalea maritima TaxID=3242416 RepID=UPI003529A809
MTYSQGRIRGFGLIEVLVALAIMAFGLMTMAAFHITVINESSTSKNRAEALAIAQQRIEQMRNYTDLAVSQADFHQLFPIVTEFANQATHQGTNTLFTRQEMILANDAVKTITVQVLWQDASGQQEQVELSTEFAYKSPGLAGDADMSQAIGPLVRSATGRARLGKGEVTEEEIASGKVVYSNGDTTGLLDRGDGDLRLTSDNDVVLTLEDACELDDGIRTNEPCTGFVEISGRVYIDRAETSVSVGGVHVIASDAAYCQRYYTASNGDAVAVTADTNSALSTATGNYDYFDYTCYLGGGWHGNVGVMIDGPEWACMGDPNAADSFDAPKVAIRRVYRGMAYKTDDTNAPITDNKGNTIYYSVGVADALILPAEGQAGHDFVVSNLSSSDESLCTLGDNQTDPVMMHPDSNVNGSDGDLFAGVPTDFFCLNQNSDWIDSVKMDAYGYSSDNYCPFDPSDPPSQKHTISGDLFITFADGNYDKLDNFWIYTSDGYYNCGVSLPDLVGTHAYRWNYQCDVFDWGNGWTGYVQITPDLSTFTCNPLAINIADNKAITGDSTIGDFVCHDNASAASNMMIVKGNITIASGAIEAITLDDSACTITGTTYECVGENFDVNNLFNGTITYKASKAKACVTYINNTTAATLDVTNGSQQSTVAISNAQSGIMNIDVTVNNGQCATTNIDDI